MPLKGSSGTQAWRRGMFDLFVSRPRGHSGQQIPRRCHLSSIFNSSRRFDCFRSWARLPPWITWYYGEFQSLLLLQYNISQLLLSLTSSPANSVPADPALYLGSLTTPCRRRKEESLWSLQSCRRCRRWPSIG